MTLLISKINNIKVIQVGDSVLTSKNNKQDTTKIGFQKVEDVVKNKNKGVTTTIDLGKGAEKYNLKFYIVDKHDIDKVYKIVRDERYCEITDKFKGKLKVYIDDYKIIDSDKHIDTTIFEINCTAQDFIKGKTVNYTSKLKSTVEEIKKDIEEQINNIVKENIKSVDTIVDKFTNKESFVDETLNTIQNGMIKVLDVKSKALNAFNNVKSKVDRINRLTKTLKRISLFPQDFVNLVMETIDDEKEQFAEIFDLKIPVKSESGAVEEESFKDIEEGDISDIQYKELLGVHRANQLNNLIVVAKNINIALNKEFSTQESFEKHISDTIERLNYTQYTYDEIIAKQQIIKAYANTQKYRSIKEIEITEKRPLIEIVYSLYGNLDNYEDIEELNNFKDNDAVSGIVKVYEV